MSNPFATVAALLRRKELPAAALVPTLCSLLHPLIGTPHAADIYRPMLGETDGARLYCRLAAVLDHGSKGGAGLSSLSDACLQLHEYLVRSVSDDHELTLFLLSDISRTKLVVKLAPAVARALFRAATSVELEELTTLRTVATQLLQRIKGDSNSSLIFPRLNHATSDEAMILLSKWCCALPDCALDNETKCAAQALLNASLVELTEFHCNPSGLGFFIPVDSAAFLRLRHILVCIAIAASAATLSGPVPVQSVQSVLELLSSLVQKHFPLSVSDGEQRPSTARSRPGSAIARSAHSDPLAPLEFLSEAVCHALQSCALLAVHALSVAPQLADDQAVQVGDLVNHRVWDELTASINLAQARAERSRTAACEVVDAGQDVLRQQQLKRHESEARFVRQLQLDALAAVTRLTANSQLSSFVSGSLWDGTGGTRLLIVHDKHGSARYCSSASHLAHRLLSVVDASVCSEWDVSVAPSAESVIQALFVVVEFAFRSVTLLFTCFYSHESGSRTGIADFFGQIHDRTFFPFLGELDRVVEVALRASSVLLSSRADSSQSSKQMRQSGYALLLLLETIHSIFALIVASGDAFAALSMQLQESSSGLPPFPPLISFESVSDAFLKDALRSVLQVLNELTSPQAAPNASDRLALVKTALRAVAVAMQCVDLDSDDIATQTVHTLFKAATWAAEQHEQASCLQPVLVNRMLSLYTSPRARRAPHLFTCVGDALRALFTQQQLNTAQFVDSAVLRSVLVEQGDSSRAASSSVIETSLRALCIAGIVGSSEEPLVTDDDLKLFHEQLLDMLHRREICGVAALRDICKNSSDSTRRIFADTAWIEVVFPALLQLAANDEIVYVVVCDEIVPHMPLVHLPPTATLRFVSQLVSIGGQKEFDANPTVGVVCYFLFSAMTENKRRKTAVPTKEMLLDFAHAIVIPRVVPLITTALVDDRAKALSVRRVQLLFEAIRKLEITDELSNKILNEFEAKLASFSYPTRHPLLIRFLLDLQSSRGTEASEKVKYAASCVGATSPLITTNRGPFLSAADFWGRLYALSCGMEGSDFTDQLVASFIDEAHPNASGVAESINVAASLRLVPDEICLETLSISLAELESNLTTALLQIEEAEMDSIVTKEKKEHVISSYICSVFGFRSNVDSSSPQARLCQFAAAWLSGVLLECQCANHIDGTTGDAAANFLRDDAASMLPEVIAARQTFVLAAIVRTCSSGCLGSRGISLLSEGAGPTDGITECNSGRSLSPKLLHIIRLWQDALARGLRHRRDAGGVRGFSNVVADFLAELNKSQNGPRGLVLLRSLLALCPDYL